MCNIKSRNSITTWLTSDIAARYYGMYGGRLRLSRHSYVHVQLTRTTNRPVWWARRHTSVLFPMPGKSSRARVLAQTRVQRVWIHSLIINTCLCLKHCISRAIKV